MSSDGFDLGIADPVDGFSSSCRRADSDRGKIPLDQNLFQGKDVAVQLFQALPVKIFDDAALPFGLHNGIPEPIVITDGPAFDCFRNAADRNLDSLRHFDVLF